MWKSVFFFAPVVGDLGDSVGVGDRVLQVRHEHEVPRVVPVVVDGVVVNVAEDGLGGGRRRWVKRTVDFRDTFDIGLKWTQLIFAAKRRISPGCGDGR